MAKNNNETKNVLTYEINDVEPSTVSVGFGKGYLSPSKSMQQVQAKRGGNTIVLCCSCGSGGAGSPKKE